MKEVFESGMFRLGHQTVLMNKKWTWTHRWFEKKVKDSSNLWTTNWYTKYSSLIRVPFVAVVLWNLLYENVGCCFFLGWAATQEVFRHLLNESYKLSFVWVPVWSPVTSYRQFLLCHGLCLSSSAALFCWFLSVFCMDCQNGRFLLRFVCLDLWTVAADATPPCFKSSLKIQHAHAKHSRMKVMFLLW